MLVKYYFGIQNVVHCKDRLKRIPVSAKKSKEIMEKINEFIPGKYSPYNNSSDAMFKLENEVLVSNMRSLSMTYPKYVFTVAVYPLSKDMKFSLLYFVNGEMEVYTIKTIYPYPSQDIIRSALKGN